MNNSPHSKDNQLFDLLPESVIKVDASLKIIFKNKFFLNHFPGIDDLKQLIGNHKEVFLINSKYEPIQIEELPESIAFKTRKETINNIIGSNNIIHREIRWLNISCRPIINENNECLEVLSVIKDISSFYISKKGGSKNMQLYKDHLEKSGEHIFRIGFYPKKHFLYISPNIHQTFGYSKADYMDNPNLFIDMIHSEDVHHYQSLLEDKFKKKNRARLRFVTKEGLIKWCNISFFPHFYGDTNEFERLEGIISNITDFEHKKSELLLKDKIIHGILNKTKSFQYTCLNDKHYTMIHLDEEFEKFTGFSSKSILRNAERDFNSLIHFQDRQRVHHIVDQSIKENNVWELEYRMENANGDYIWVKEYGLSHMDEFGQDVLSGIIANINVLKLKEENANQISKNFENIVSNSKLGTWEWNIESGETVFNERWAEIIGYTLEELSPVDINTWINHTYPADLEKSNLELQKHFKGETDLYECEARMKHKSGKWIWVLDTGRVTSRDSDGNPISMSGVHQDITKLKEIEDNLQQKLDFEKVLANVSKNFISEGNIDFDLAINNAFEDLGHLTKASRIYIFLFQENNQIMDNTHEWCAEGVSREIENLQNLPISIFPWWMNKLYNGEIIQIPDVSNMPDEAKAEKDILESQNIKSLIVVGLRTQGKLVGFIGFDDVLRTVAEWDKDEQYLLIWMSQIFSSVFENKWNRDQLIKSESKFRNIFEKNPSPQLLVDPENGDILDGNQAALNFYGYNESELINKNFIHLYNNQISDMHFKENLHILKNNSYLEYQQITADNKIKKVELFGGIIEVDKMELLHIILRDVTMQYNISDRNTILRTAIDNSPFGVTILNKAGDVLDMNKKAMHITGYHLDELKNKHLSILDTEQFTNEYFEKVWNNIQSGQAWSDEISRKRKDGRIYWINYTLIPVYNSDNLLENIVLIEENIDDKKQQMIALEEAKKAAVESNRLKSAFLSTINHELRTPLNHIIGLSEVIQEMSLDESIRDYSSIVTNSGLNLLEIIEDILSLAIYDAGELHSRKQTIKILDLYISLKENLKDFHSKSAKKNQIELKFNPKVKSLHENIITDQNKIVMIFNNLFKNAIKFTEQGFIEFGILEENRDLIFYVKDSGIGIPENKKEFIFDFFRQVDDSDTRKFDGVGIGLTIAQKAANVLNAKIKVNSKVGEGSTFSLVLHQSIIHKPTAVNLETGGLKIPDLRDKKILITEDDEDSLLVTKLILNQTHAQIEEATDGKMALDMQNERKYDLILMDLKMPNMDGFEATRLIKEINPNQIIIGLTAYSFVEDKNRALEAGCDDILSKPINKSFIYKILSKYLVDN